MAAFARLWLARMGGEKGTPVKGMDCRPRLNALCLRSVLTCIKQSVQLLDGVRHPLPSVCLRGRLDAGIFNDALDVGELIFVEKTREPRHHALECPAQNMVLRVDM
ncbi:hypothetical protein, partial [Burkholderia multivorans]|uniref:hypothetical protein n=1 Tax=Burkholderia multivorans TaxID=87883 RepID=UPI0019553769